MKKIIPYVFLTLIVVYLIWLIRPAFFGQLTGTFQTQTVPTEYTKLEQFLLSQKKFSRTFWVPDLERYGFYSPVHPAVVGKTYFNVSSPSGVIDYLKKQDTENKLQEAGVKYVIVPYDVEGELFINNRKYDEKLYKEAIISISAISWLTPVTGFGKIAVFEVPNPKDHFYVVSNISSTRSSKLESVQSIHMVNPTKYSVFVTNVRKGDTLVFGESFDTHWQAQIIDTKNKKTSVVCSTPFHNAFNSFILTHDGSYTLNITYTPQVFVTVGVIISIVSFITLVGFLVFLFIKTE